MRWRLSIVVLVRDRMGAPSLIPSKRILGKEEAPRTLLGRPLLIHRADRTVRSLLLALEIAESKEPGNGEEDNTKRGAHPNNRVAPAAVRARLDVGIARTARAVATRVRRRARAAGRDRVDGQRWVDERRKLGRNRARLVGVERGLLRKELGGKDRYFVFRNVRQEQCPDLIWVPVVVHGSVRLQRERLDLVSYSRPNGRISTLRIIGARANIPSSPNPAASITGA
jgi:hypothetical protein